VAEVDSATVRSDDGTTIRCRRIGSGPPLLVLHGAMQSALSHRDLALALADRVTVVLPDRRGRGASGPFGSDWSLATEVEDVAALLAGTGARCAVGRTARCAPDGPAGSRGCRTRAGWRSLG
jgi:pimeloyl-ACP methyl ester carboxylesterase